SGLQRLLVVAAVLVVLLDELVVQLGQCMHLGRDFLRIRTRVHRGVAAVIVIIVFAVVVLAVFLRILGVLGRRRVRLGNGVVLVGIDEAGEDLVEATLALEV